MAKNNKKLGEELKKRIGKIKLKSEKKEEDKKESKEKKSKKIIGNIGMNFENPIEESIENDLEVIRGNSSSLRPVAEVRGINPVHLERSLANIWTGVKEENEELYSAQKNGKNAHEYDTNKAVKEGIFYDESATSSGKRANMESVGRESWIESQIKETNFINPEEKLRKTQKDVETDYIRTQNVDMNKVGRDVIKKPQEYWSK